MSITAQLAPGQAAGQAETAKAAETIDPAPMAGVDRLAGGRRRSRVALPGGRWPWWGWALYLALVGPPVLVALAPAALLRLALPKRWRVWGFRRRRTAAGYLAAVLLLAGGAAGTVFRDSVPVPALVPALRLPALGIGAPGAADAPEVAPARDAPAAPGAPPAAPAGEAAPAH